MIRVFLAAALVAFPVAASAVELDGDRFLASGKLDASASFDFSCSVVNKSPAPPEECASCDGDGRVLVAVVLKEGDGEQYVDPVTFTPVGLAAFLDPGESLTVTAPARFVGTTSLYCWALTLPAPSSGGDASIFGTFLVRDAQDRATAALPLRDDMRGGIGAVHRKMSEILAWGETTGGPTKKKLPETRGLASGKLDANAGFDYSCSVVNKNPAEPSCPSSTVDTCDFAWPPGSIGDIDLTLSLKNADGSVYIDPSTFQPATLDVSELLPGEAAMLVAPAGFGGATSVYCWAEVPFHASVFGSFLTRDAFDRATAATPLEEDVHSLLHSVLHRLGDIHSVVDALTGN